MQEYKTRLTKAQGIIFFLFGNVSKLFSSFLKRKGFLVRYSIFLRRSQFAFRGRHSISGQKEDSCVTPTTVDQLSILKSDFYWSLWRWGRRSFCPSVKPFFVRLSKKTPRGYYRSNLIKFRKNTNNCRIRPLRRRWREYKATFSIIASSSLDRRS